jgi:hypothetical protein
MCPIQLTFRFLLNNNNNNNNNRNIRVITPETLALYLHALASNGVFYRQAQHLPHTAA